MSTASKFFPDPPLASPENGNPEKFRTQTFLITLSPKTDVTPETIEEFVSYIKKKTQYAFVVTEFGENGKKHIHACCVWSMPVEKRNIYDYWSKKMVVAYPGSIGRYAVKVTIQYDHKWYDEYLRKGGDVVFDNYERDSVTKFFPSLEQQAVLIESKQTSELRLHIVDVLLSEWIEKDPSDSSYESAISFIKHRMYVENKTPYYIDNRKMQQMCWFLYEKRNRITAPNVSDKNYASQLTGNSFVH